MESESAPSRAEGVGAAVAVAGGSESEIDLDRPEDKCGSDRQEAPRGLIASAAGTASIAGMMQHGAEEPKDAKAKRIDDVEERLFHLGLLDRVSPDLYRPKEVTGQFILELWRQVDADTGVGDRGEAFLERLKKWVLNHSGAAAVRPAVRGA